MIKAKEKEINLNYDQIMRLDRILLSIKNKQQKLLEKDTDLHYELEELKDELQNND